MNDEQTSLTSAQQKALQAIREGRKPNLTAVKSLVRQGLVRIEIVGDMSQPGWYRTYHITDKSLAQTAEIANQALKDFHAALNTR